MTAQRRVASLLIWLFVTTSAVRLIGMLPPFQQVTLPVAIVHAFDLVALTGVSLMLLRAVRGRSWLQVALAIGLGGVGMVLLAFDAASVLAIMFHQRVAPLATVPIFYCNSESISACVFQFPGIAGLVVLGWLTWSALICFAADVLAARCERLFEPRFRFASYAFLAVWGAVWLLAFVQVAAREPLVRFLGKTPFGAQPRALIQKPRPDYRLAPSIAVKPRTLVLITIDSLRADAVELAPGKPSRTPFLQELAASGQLHDYGPAVAICPTSYCGITGVLSSSDWATLQQGPPLMLPDVLAANGYGSHYLLSGPHLRVLNLAKLYGPNVTTLLDDSSPDSSGLIDDREQVRRLKDLKLTDPARSFVFIHLMSAHAAGLRFDAPASTASKWSGLLSSARYTGPYSDYYDRGVRQSDLIVRQLFDVLKARGLLDDALIVITADHGERLAGATGHGGEVDLSTALIPLLIYDPRGGSDWPESGDMLASQIDVAPTLLAAAGIAVPPQWQGWALQANAVRTAAPTDTVGQSAVVGRVDGKFVMVRCELREGSLRAIASNPDLERRALADYRQWSSGLAPRKDATRCGTQPAR